MVMTTSHGSCSCCARLAFAVLLLAGSALLYVLLFVGGGLESEDLESEVKVFADKMGPLAPGMTLCEMGAADGTLLVRLGPLVMPGGRLMATSPLDRELDAMSKAVVQAGMAGALTTFKATDDDWAPGMPDGSCDVIYSRMVYHMIPAAAARRYPAQWKRSLKAGGKLFITDHNPLDGGTTGPRRPILEIGGLFGLMPVVPQETEQAEIEAGGFVATDGPFAHPFYAGGFAAVYKRTSEVGTA